MKIALFGDSKHEIEKIVIGSGLDVVEKDPDFVFTYGGDGTLMASEHAFPGIPKLALRNSVVCKKCSPLSNESVLDKFLKGEYVLDEVSKLEVRVGKNASIGLNDIVVHNNDPRQAIRYRLWVDEREISRVIIGDGVVIATPFGSTAYYRSITHSFFEVGMGVAFNNSTEPFDHMVVPETSIIKIKLERGPALVYADNRKEHFEAVEGDEVIIKKADESAKVVRVGV